MIQMGTDKVTRLVLLFTLLLLLLLVGGGWIFHALMLGDFQDTIRQAAQTEGRFLRSLLESHPRGPLAAWRALDAEALRLAAGLDRLELLPADAGAEAASSWGLPAPLLVDSLRLELEMGFELLPEPVLEDGELYQSVYEPILDGGGEIEAILILETGARASRRLAALSRGLWMATGLALLFAIFVFVSMTGILRRARRHQRELDRSEHLAGVGTLAAGLAHEIRNPLAIIGGSAELIEMRAAGEAERDKAADILEEVERLQRLLGDFLHFARPWELESTRLDLAEFWRKTFAEQRELHPDIDYTLEVEEGLPSVEADADRLRQLALNLLGNAAAVLNGRGAVRVELSRSRDGLRIEFSDDGPGVPDELRARIFQPFVSGRPGGSGLGLAVCRALALAHGGDLRLSESGPTGTRFTLDLPSAAGRAPSAPRTERKKP